LAELDRIFQREAVKEMKEIWRSTVPKIIAVAADEPNPHLRSLSEEAQASNISDGTYIYVVYLKCSQSMYTCSFQVYTCNYDVGISAS